MTETLRRGGTPREFDRRRDALTERRKECGSDPNNEPRRDGSRQTPSWKCHGQHQRPGSLFFHFLIQEPHLLRVIHIQQLKSLPF